MATENPIQPRPVGRPSDYKDEYADLLLAYFQMPAWDTAVNGKMVEGFFPTLSGFACQLKTTSVTLWNWANAKDENGVRLHEEFFNAYMQAKEYQQDYFVKGYMAGKYVNPGIAALIAKNIMDWKDKQELDQNTTATVTAKVTSKVALDFSDLIVHAKNVPQ